MALGHLEITASRQPDLVLPLAKAIAGQVTNPALRARAAALDGQQGRRLQIVEALSAHWGWHRQDGGKAVFAILAPKA